MPEHVRAYIYRVFTALVPLGILYGVVSENEAGLWVGVAAAALSFGEGALATKYTTTKKSLPPPTEETVVSPPDENINEI